jgi:hypothetical protein
MFNVILANLAVVCGLEANPLDCKMFIKTMMCSGVVQTLEVAEKHNQACTVTLMSGSKKSCEVFVKGFCNE